MFKLTSELTFSWPVKVIEPNPNAPGEVIEHEFTAQFSFIDPEEAKASDAARGDILKAMKPDMKLKELRSIQAALEDHDRTALLRVLRGWSDIVDENDKPIPFNPETFAEVYRHDRVRNALVRAYGDAISDDKARLGN